MCCRGLPWLLVWGGEDQEVTPFRRRVDGRAMSGSGKHTRKKECQGRRFRIPAPGLETVETMCMCSAERREKRSGMSWQRAATSKVKVERNVVGRLPVRLSAWLSVPETRVSRHWLEKRKKNREKDLKETTRDGRKSASTSWCSGPPPLCWIQGPPGGAGGAAMSLGSMHLPRRSGGFSAPLHRASCIEPSADWQPSLQSPPQGG